MIKLLLYMWLNNYLYKVVIIISSNKLQQLLSKRVDQL